jgi:hypothetical protein
MVLLRWSVGAVGGARFGVLRFGEGRVPSRDNVGRARAPIADEKGCAPTFIFYMMPCIGIGPFSSFYLSSGGYLYCSVMS